MNSDDRLVEISSGWIEILYFRLIFELEFGSISFLRSLFQKRIRIFSALMKILMFAQNFH